VSHYSRQLRAWFPLTYPKPATSIAAWRDLRIERRTRRREVRRIAKRYRKPITPKAEA
jgi:hypothetical protein